MVEVPDPEGRKTWHPAGMGFFKWVYRLPGRVNRSMEKTALAASVVESEGMGGTQWNMPSVNAALREMETSGAGEGDSADSEDR